AWAVERCRPGPRAGGRRADPPQQLVAGEMAGGVVVALEVVDVGERDAPAVPVALRPRLHRREVLGEAVAVAEAGQRVLARVAVHAAVERRDPRGADEHALERLAGERLEDEGVRAPLPRVERGVLVGAGPEC